MQIYTQWKRILIILYIKSRILMGKCSKNSSVVGVFRTPVAMAIVESDVITLTRAVLYHLHQKSLLCIAV